MRMLIALITWVNLVALGACGTTKGQDPDAGPTADASSVEYPASPYEAVDLFVGTGGDGYGVGSAFPGAAMPFSMVKLSPDTSANNGSQSQWNHCGGYAYTDAKILGFSHTHMHGIGLPAYGTILFMPTVGVDAVKLTGTNYRSDWDHATETAAPGYYAVTVEDSGVRAELTTGMRMGYHRWTWPGGTAAGEAVVIIDVARSMGTGEALNSAVEIIPAERRVRGWMTNEGQFGPSYPIWFDAVFDRDFVSHGVWQDGSNLVGDATADGTEVKAWVALDLAGGDVAEAEVAISYVDATGVAANRTDEAVIGNGGFDAAHGRARTSWEDLLGLIEIEGGTPREHKIFYSALYHAALTPTNTTDSDGRYASWGVHQGSRPFYTDFSLWDTYRTLHPFLILLFPEESADMAQSLVLMADHYGNLPRWPMGPGEAGSMIGTSADIVLAESYLKGVTDFEVDRAWAYMWEHARGPVCCSGRGGVEDYITMGYLPSDRHGGSVSKTQEYAWDDWALSLLATELGKDTHAATLLAQSRTIGTLWHEESRFFRGRRADGSWDQSFNDEAWEDYYTEGDAWQHLWLSPHADLLGEIMGGKAAFIERLNEFFDKSAAYWEVNTMGYWISLPFYWHGNEPDLHAAYLYAAAGRPAGTQRWVRWIMDHHYDLGQHGLAGNDDAGTLSAWFLFSALGFYPWAGSDRYYVGTPAFDRATIHLPGGDFVITSGGRAQGYYIQSATLNGAPLTEPWFTHADLVNGGTLHFELGAEESDWGQVD